MSAPQVGKKYRVKASIGNEEQGLHLQVGWVGTVLDVLAAEPGVHTGGIILSFPTVNAAIGSDGEPIVVHHTRNWPCPPAQFDELFEEVTA